MNNKPFTLYYIDNLKYIHSDSFSTIARKILDVKRISKGMTMIGWKENNNHYAILKENSHIISMGALKTIETKNKNIIYEGQKIYSNSKKELYDYIKREVTNKIQKIKKEIARIHTIKCNEPSTVTDDIYEEYIDRLYYQIKKINTNLKQLITNIKKL